MVTTMRADTGASLRSSGMTDSTAAATTTVASPRARTSLLVALRRRSPGPQSRTSHNERSGSTSPHHKFSGDCRGRNGWLRSLGMPGRTTTGLAVGGGAAVAVVAIWVAAFHSGALHTLDGNVLAALRELQD